MSRTNHTISTGTPVTLGAPLGKVAISPCSPSQRKRPGKASPERKGISGSVAAASRTPRIWVEPPVAHFSPTRESPRRMKSEARVTMKDGSRVLTTISPLNQPTTIATAKAERTPPQSGKPSSRTTRPMTTPAKPIIDPTERSNSPAMMSSAAAVAMMPSSAESVRNVIEPWSE